MNSLPTQYEPRLTASVDDEKYVDNPNGHYLAAMNNLNKTNQRVALNRLPTLGEILANKTKQPVDFYSFYAFMRDVEGKVDYLDFWIDLIQHLNLCKHYVKGLRDLIIRQSAYNDHTSLTVDPGANRLLRALIPFSEPLKHQLLSSLILLELIINDNILEDNDLNRLSQFLRGDISMEHLDPKLREAINLYNKHHSGATLRPNSNLPLALPVLPYGEQGLKRVLSQLRLLDDEEPLHAHLTQPSPQSKVDFPTPPRRLLAISPLLLEKLIRDLPAGLTGARQLFVTRDNLKELSHQLLLKYFVEDLEKNLNLPHNMHANIIHAIDVEGRDDPDVFKQVKEYVFNRMEQDHLPKFLNFTAIRNINHSNFFRVIAGFFFLFGAFWIGFTLIFLGYGRLLRAVVVAPFFIAFYLLVSLIILIDPLLAWTGYTELFSRRLGPPLRKVQEPFIYRLLVKRSLWVLVYVLICTAILLVVFSCVPSHRL